MSEQRRTISKQESHNEKHKHANGNVKTKLIGLAFADYLCNNNTLKQNEPG